MALSLAAAEDVASFAGLPPPPAICLEHELGTTPLQTVIGKNYVDKFVKASIS